MNDTAPELLLDELIFGEQAYQIFSVHARWSRAILHGLDEVGLGPSWFEGLPARRMWDTKQWYEMPREIVTFDEIVATALAEWWPDLKREEEDKNLADLTIDVNFVRWETWCPGWFSHWTWDTGLSDAKVLGSFQRYVWRTEVANRREGKIVDGYLQEPYCLMGAENRIRWHGLVTGEPCDGRTDAPCRCPICKKLGIIRIGH